MGELDPADHGERSSIPLVRSWGVELDPAGHVELNPAGQAMASSRESRGAEDAAKRMKASGAWAKSAAAKLVEDAPRLGKAGSGCDAERECLGKTTERRAWDGERDTEPRGIASLFF